MKILWGEGAQADFIRAIEFLQEQSPSGARRVGRRILDAVALLERFPRLARASKHRGLRQLVVPKTPYIVIYRVHDGRVEIRAVVHCRQRRRR